METGEEKEKEGNNLNNILNQEFFDTIKESKKINLKAKKINELTNYFKKVPNYNQLPEIKNKIQDLLNLLLINLNENNNNYVLAQMELIKTLNKTINKEENYKNFIKLSLPKLFDKFYLGNQKINDTLIEIFNDFISFKVLSIKDYYQYIENIPLEEEDNYRINIINFLYNQVNNDDSVLLNNIPKSINELIKKLVNDNESDISETASKILNILINRDIESNKKKDQDEIKEKDNSNNDKEIKEFNISEKIQEKKQTDLFVKNIVNAIKNEADKNEIKNNNNEKKEEEIIKNKDIENKIKEDSLLTENDSLSHNIIKQDKKEEEKEGNKENIEEKKEVMPEKKKIDERQSEMLKENEKNKVNEDKIENKGKKEEKIEEKKEEKKEEKIDEKKEKVNKENIKDNLLEERNEQKPAEEKKEEIKEIKKEEKTNNDIKQLNEKKDNLEQKKEEISKNDNDILKDLNQKIEEKKEIEIKGSSAPIVKDEKNQETTENKDKEGKTNKLKKGGVGAKRTGIKSQISKFRKNLGKNKKKDGFEFELVEKKKDGNIEKNEIIPEEKENNKNDEIKESPKEVTIPEKKENIQKEKEKEKENEKAKEKEKEVVNIDKKEEQNIKNEEKNIEVKENLIVEVPKKEDVKKENEVKKEKDKPKEEAKEEKKIEPKKEIKTANPKKETKENEEIKKEEEKKDNLEQNEQIKDNPPDNTKKTTSVNQQSLSEFEKKLQLALEQEEKEGNKNGIENLTDNPPIIKQKKEDPKFDEIKSILGKEIVDSLFSPKWEIKKHGFELINEFINNKPNNSYNIIDLLEYMKLKLKNYKETNFNINREAINIYINMIKKKIISKDLLIPIIIAYHEKLADIKLKDNLIELINNSFDIIEPSSILKQIISKISKKNNAKLLIEYATFLGNIVEEYDVKDLPNKEIIDFCKVLANNSNPQVRTSAISLLCILYKYLGKDVKTLTRDIKESTLKLIDAELDKVKVIDPKESAGKKKKVASASGDGKTSAGGGGDLIPPQDISKKITTKMIKDLDGKWAEKKEACEAIEKVLTTANMRILPNGLNNIMTTFKKKLSDSNKNFVKLIVSLLSKFIESLKQGFKQWAKPIALALIPNLADKNQLMRNECQNCFDKWVEFVGIDSLAVHFPQFLKTDNTEMRIEIMNFFIKYKDKFNKSIGELVYKDMMNPLLICLQDRSSHVRNASEEIIKYSLNFIPINNYYKKSEDFKPAITKTLKQILDKIKKETASATTQENNTPTEQENNHHQQQTNSEQNNNNTTSNIKNNSSNDITSIPNPKKVVNLNQKKNDENSNTKSNTKRSSKINSIQLNETTLKTESGMEDSENNDNNSIDEQMKNYNTINMNKTTKKLEKDTKKNTSKINVKRAKPKRKLSEDDLVNPLGTAINKQIPASSVGHLASNSTILRKNEKKSFQKNTSNFGKTLNPTVFLLNVKVIPNKLKRYEKDKRAKFNLETVSKDNFNKLKDQCKGLFVEEFSKKIFSDDFRKQVEAFKEMKGQIDKKINIPTFLDNLDLILKIIGIKILNNLNPTLMKNFFELLDSLYLVLFENKYKLNETESNIIINILVDKLSLNNNTLREHLLSLLNQYIELMDTNKIMVTVINVALNKNNKIKTDILDLMIDLTTNQKLNISTKTYAKLLCKFLPIYDNAIKSKTLSLFQEIYSNIKNELWNLIEVSEKDAEYLKENLYLENDDEEEEEEEDEKLNNEENGSNPNENNINDNEQKINLINNNSEDNKENNNNIYFNQSVSLTKESLQTYLNLLTSEEEKLNAIINIHEIICGKFNVNKALLISNVDEIIIQFRKVSKQLFCVGDITKIPIKFAKYLAIVLCKLASNKELISNLSYEVLLDLSRDLLNYLLINGLDKIGENKEGNIIFKSINSTMLRLLENCNTTFVICTLLELIKEFHIKEDKNLINLAVKCLLKTAQNLSDNINSIEIDKILLQIHLLLLALQQNNPDLSKKTSMNNTIINAIKHLVADFVKYRKDKIFEDYSKTVKNHQINDKFLLRWIKAAKDKQ